MRVLFGYLMAVVSAYVLASLLATQLVLWDVAAMGVPVNLADRLHASSHDLVGLAPTFGALLAIGFLIAFPVAGGIIRWLPGLRVLGFTLAGAVAMLVLLSALQILLGVMPLAAARTWTGTCLMVLAGAMGGRVFAAVSVAPDQSHHEDRTVLP